MSDLYNASPGTYGGFTSPYPGGSSSKGYYQQPLNLPFYEGRSILATIPEYQRNPLMLEKDLLYTVSEGRNNMMKLLMETMSTGGGIEVKDVRYRMPVKLSPLHRIYLDAQTLKVNTNGISTIKVKGNTTKISTAMPGGNPKQVGDIARIEKDQYLMLMFSWCEPRRTSTVSGSSCIVYEPQATEAAPVPELVKVTEVNYEESYFKCKRMWAGEQRTDAFTYSTTTIPTTTILASDSATTAVWGITSTKIPSKQAFLIPMAKSMKEDEIDAKVRHFSNTWKHGIVQRHLLAWGSQHFAEVISRNLGIASPLAESRTQAIKDFYDHWEWASLFSEKDEWFDSETGYWQGATDGLLSNIPKSHYVAIKGIDYAGTLTAGSSTSWGSFHPIIFNKLLENYGYYGSPNKVLVCGSAFHTAFSSMINFMTQSVEDIKSEWAVEGKRFRTSNGLTVDVVPSDKLTLNGLSHSAILYDKAAFKPVKLMGYPGADILEIKNENPLKQNGLIHGVKSFIDMDPDAHWVMTVVEKTRADGTPNATAYASTDVLGNYLS